jgi:NTE family protein
MPKPRIGICLSGGGFRAAFYALGVLRYLAEAELLESVVAISAVSGGSIAAAALADRADLLAAQGWTVDAFLADIDRPFRTALTTHISATRGCSNQRPHASGAAVPAVGRSWASYWRSGCT